MHFFTSFSATAAYSSSPTALAATAIATTIASYCTFAAACLSPAHLRHRLRYGWLLHRPRQAPR